MDNFQIFYQKFLEDYQNFISSNLQILCKFEKYYKIKKFKNFNLRFYGDPRLETNDIFLIIPSVFNSAEIFFINRGKNFVDLLTQSNQVIILEWIKRNSLNNGIKNYIHDISSALRYIKKTSSNKINIIGHCLGGTLAIAAIRLNSLNIRSLTLLTTPWDFLYYQPIIKLFKCLKLNSSVNLMTHIPKIFMQILFFLLSPKSFTHKIIQYNKLKESQDKELYLTLEYWLSSGTDLTRRTFTEIIDSLIEKNLFLNLRFRIGRTIINPKQLTLPICQVIAKEDWLVPLSMTENLTSILQKSHVIEVEGGHISYLISNKLKKFYLEYNNWLRSF